MGLIDLSNRVALVTGGSRGIGAATARMFAAAGAKVALTYRSRQAEAEAVAESIRAQRATASPLVFASNVNDPKDCAGAVERTVATFQRLDFFVANAAIWPAVDEPVIEMPAERWNATIKTNLDSVFFGTQAALKVMEPNGSVVIISSTAGQRGEAFHADYAATKGGIIAFVKSVCIEVASRGIRVNAVAPGWVDTDMSADPYAKDGGSGRAQIERGIPLGRVATPEEIAGPIVFLCSALAGGMTGEIVNVNGGSVLCG